MNPIFERRDWFWLYVLSWLVIGQLLAVAVERPGGLSWAEALAVLTPITLVYGFVCLSAWYVCRATPFRTIGSLAAAASIGSAVLVAGGFFVATGAGWSRLLGQVPPLARLPARFWNEAWLLFTIAALLYLLAIAVHYAVISAGQSREAEKRALGLQLLAREAELKALRAQIDPHFLFNSLNSISALTGADPPAARRMCLLLGEFLRQSVTLGAHALITFDEELALAERYLEIERARFGSRLAIERHVDDQASRCLVPALLLQPLVENAVTHGVAHLLEGGTVRLEAQRAGRSLRIAVENRCDPDRPKRPRTGLGLANVGRRLDAQYSGAARIEVAEAPDRFRVELTLPCDASPAPGAAHV